jgi:hypothetical protein
LFSRASAITPHVGIRCGSAVPVIGDRSIARVVVASWDGRRNAVPTSSVTSKGTAEKNTTNVKTSTDSARERLRKLEREKK